MTQKPKLIIIILIIVALILASVGIGYYYGTSKNEVINRQVVLPETESFAETEEKDISSEKPEPKKEFSPSDVVPYDNNPSLVINGNIPFFSDDEKKTESFETYGELDKLGRCTKAYACIDRSMMPETEREPIGNIQPSGWQLIKYDFIEDIFLYNRCHLIGYQLTGQNANERNLITGTRYMNVQGMLPYENQVAEYLKSSDNHALYRVTPIFDGDNLVASGVLMEAYSVEDEGALQFCVYCYNVQPGVIISYDTGESVADETYEAARLPSSASDTDGEYVDEVGLIIPEGTTYVLNENTKRFHYADCDSVYEMLDKNRAFTDLSREELIEQGYRPCGNCKP